MFIQFAAAAAAPAAENPYGLMEALEQGGAIAWAVFLILCAMSVGSFYILFTKLIEQQKIINQSRKVRSEEHTSELQSLMRISYAVFCLKKNNIIQLTIDTVKHEYKQ